MTINNKVPVRAKFYVVSITDYGVSGKSVKLSAMYSSGKPEDNQFAAATPQGTLEMWVSNPKTMDYFTPGKSYYLDFTEAEA